jgi:membrane dipeptidase
VWRSSVINIPKPFFFSAFVASALVSQVQLIAAPFSMTNDSAIAEVLQLLHEVPLIDGHNDLPWQFRKRGGDLNAIDLRVNNRSAKPPLATDIPRLRAGGVLG